MTEPQALDAVAQLRTLVEQQQAEMQALREKLAQQEARLAGLAPTQPSQSESVIQTTSRRKLLKRLAASAAAAAIATTVVGVGQETALADTSSASTATYGFLALPSTAPTAAATDPLISGSFGVVGIQGYVAPAVGSKLIQSGVAGVLGYSDGGSGIYGISKSSYGLQGVSSSGAGVYGTTTSGQFAVIGDTNTSAGGVQGKSNTGDGVYGISYGTGSGNGVYGLTNGSGVGVYGLSNGAANPANAPIGVKGQSASGYGGYFVGGQAPLFLFPGGTVGAPSTGTHQQGEIYVDSAGGVYVCSVAGQPGTWTRLAPAYLSKPTRVLGQPTTAEITIQGGTVQYFQIEGTYGADVIPSTAQSISGALVGYGAVNGGYITVFPGNVSTPPPVATLAYAGGGAFTGTAFSTKLGPIPVTNKAGIGIFAFSTVKLTLDVVYFQ